MNPSITSEKPSLGQKESVVSLVTDATRKATGVAFDELAELVRGFVKLISGAETLELEATDGMATIAKSPEVFTWGIDGDFLKWGCDVKAEPTKAQKVQVHEMVKNGTFAQIFKGLSDDLDSLCLTQAQIIQFVVKHKKWLRTDGYGTLFLFKVGDEFFVAYVSLDSDERPHVFVFRFLHDDVWCADYRPRLVVPQLELAN